MCDPYILGFCLLTEGTQVLPSHIILHIQHACLVPWPYQESAAHDISWTFVACVETLTCKNKMSDPLNALKHKLNCQMPCSAPVVEIIVLLLPEISVFLHRFHFCTFLATVTKTNRTCTNNLYKGC